MRKEEIICDSCGEEINGTYMSVRRQSNNSTPTNSKKVSHYHEDCYAGELWWKN